MLTPQEKIIEIVKTHTQQIYQEPLKFSSIIDEYFDDELGDLLKIIIEKNACLLIYDLTNEDQNTMSLSYQILLENICKSVITPAVNLLCNGLDIDTEKLELSLLSLNEFVMLLCSESRVLCNDESLPKIQNNYDNFEIKDGVLISYKGNGISCDYTK